MTDRMLSGITPSSAKGLHLGNFFGAVKPHIEGQENSECFYFVANLHALNTVFNPQEVRENTDNIFIEYLAFGIDPDKTVFFIQSDIPEIPYLQTIFNNVVTVAELKRMHAYKDKLQQDTAHDAISFGLFSYPVLMAADILAFAPHGVPVGEDQAQHVEICREIAQTFNARYGDVLRVPELRIQKDVARIVGIDGKRKMSKSLGNDIPIFAEETVVKEQIMKITTDPARIRPTDPGNPEKNVCFLYLKLLDHDTIKSPDDPSLHEMMTRYRQGSIGDVAIKKVLFRTFLTYFHPYRQKKAELLKQPKYIEEVRKHGATKARKVAGETLHHVAQAVGVLA